MKILIRNGQIYDSKTCSFFSGSVLIENDTICAINPSESDELMDNIIDAENRFIIPGFVDVHTHGCAGYDFCSAEEKGLEKLAQAYLKNGTTSLMPTLASAPYPDLISASDRINKHKSQNKRGAYFLGIHLEGRYLNCQKRGAHAPQLLKPADAEEIRELITHMELPCHITAALELDRNGAFANEAISRGATLALGHTMATYQEALLAYEKYGVSFTHLFNAMPSMSHRKSGAVCAGLTCGAICEVICDGIHIAPEMIMLTYRCLGNTRLALVTDSNEATGCPDGEYFTARNPCTVKNGMVLNHEGNLAGSTLNMKKALENFMHFCDISLEEALRCATLTPAEEVGVSSIVGSIEIGKRADMLVVSKEEDSKNKKVSLHIHKIISGGEVYDCCKNEIKSLL